MAQDHENEGNDRPGESCAKELQRLRRRVAELERREAEHRQKEQVPEQSDERFRLFYEQSPLGYQSLNADGRILDVNPAWLKILGYERDNVVGRWFGDLLTPDSRQVFPDRFARFKEVGEVHDVRFEMVCGDGRTRCVEFDGRISRTPEGHFDRTHCVLRDVTERREAEQAIRRNEAKYRFFVETTNEGIWAIDADHKTTFVNARMAAMLGYAEEEMIGRVVEEFMFEEDLPAQRERMAARHEGKAARYEHRFRRKDAGEVWTLVSATPLKSSQGRFEGSFAVFADITERKRAEKALRRSEERFKAILDGAAAMVAVADTGGRWVHVNQHMADLLGYSVAELTGMLALDITHPDDRPDAQALLGRLLRGEIPSYRMDRRHLRKDGVVVWVDLSVSPLHDDQGRIEGLIGVAFDITEQKEVAWALQESEQKFRAIADYTYDLELWAGSDGRLIWMNPAVERFTGYTAEECQAMSDFPARLIHQQDRARVLALYRQACEGSSGNDVQFRVVHRDGTFTWVSASWQPIRRQDGADLGWRCSIRDIDDRVRIEEALRDSEELFRTVFEQSAVGIARVTPEGRFEHVNSRLCDILGYSRNELHEMTFRDVTHPEDLELEEADIARVLAGEIDSFEIEKRYLRKDERLVWVRLFSNVIRDEQGRVRYAIASVADITVLKESEESLLAAHRTVTALLEAVPDLLIVVDRDFRILYTNAKGHDEIRQSDSDMGRICYSRFKLLDAPCEDCSVHPVFETGGIVEREVVNPVDHRVREVRAFPIRDAEGHVTAVVEHVRDITDRKRAEELLHLTSQMLDTAPSSITVHDFQGRFLYANGKTFEIHGYSREEFMAMNLHDLDVPESKALIADRMQEIAARGEASFEVSHRRKDGSSFPLEIYVKQVVWDGIPAMLSIGTDITERKRAQEAVEGQRAELEAIYESAPVMMCVLESDRRVLYANRAFTEITGCTQEQLKAGRACGVFGCINAQTDPRGCGYGRDCEHCSIRLAMEDTFQTGTSHRDIEYRATLEHHGVRRDVVLLGATARIECGESPRVLLCLEDVTERKRVESQLRLQSLVLNQIQDRVTVTDLEGVITFINDAQVRTLGYSRDELIGVRVEKYGEDPERGAAQRQIVEETLKHGQWRGEVVNRTAEGEEVILDCRTRVVLDEKGNKTALAGIATDITERRHTERLLLQTAKLLTAIKDAQNLYITGANARDVYEALLRTLVTITESEYGFLDEVLQDESGQLYKRSLAISDISWDEDSRRLYQQHLERGLEFRNLNNLAGAPALTGKLVISNAPERDPHADGIPKGHPALRAFMGVPIYFGGRVVGVAGVANRPGGYDERIAESLEPFVATCAGIIHAVQNDAKEQQYKEALRESHANLLAILESTEDLIASRDREGRLLFFNTAFAKAVHRLFGVAAEPGLRTMDHLPPEQREYWEQVLSRVTAGESYRGEFDWDHSGDLRSYDISFNPIRKGAQIIGTVEFNRDITERKRAQRKAEQRQAELLRMSRLTTLGEMASGIAHELNQPLTAILSYGEACKRRMQEDPPDFSLIREYLGEIVSQGQRAGLIIRRVRSMAKGQQPHFVSASLQDIIRTALDMIQWELRQNEIPLCLDIAESLPPVYADPIQIEQVLLNLVRNSMDAMVGVPPEQRSLTVRATVSDGDYLCVEVRDSGVGLPPKDRGCVFDSFFTTKKEGLGIGLSISRSIVEAHRGILDAKSNPGPGATFFFRLPVHRPTGT